MKNTQFEAEDVFGDILGKNGFSPKQKMKPNVFFGPK